MNFFKKIVETTQALRKKPGMKKTIENSTGLTDKGGYTDAIVILTGELTKVMVAEKAKIVTSPIARIRETAGALLYEQMKKAGKKPVIILSGGDVYGHASTDTVLSDIMAQELHQKYNIPLSDLIQENQSIDTSQNAKYSGVLLDALKLAPESTTIVTNDFHLKRSKGLFNKYFGDVNGLAAEDILLNHEPEKGKNRYVTLIKNWISSKEQKKLKKKDKLISFFSRLPFGEKLIEGFATFNRQGGRKIPMRK